MVGQVAVPHVGAGALFGVEGEDLGVPFYGRLDGVPQTLEIVVVKKNGCLFDLIYFASPATFEQGRGDFARVVAGFEFPVGGGA